MAEPAITVSVIGRSLLDQAALEALVATLPGLCVVPLDGDPPPQVALWDAGETTEEALIPVGDLPSGTALLLLVSGRSGMVDFSFPTRAAGLCSKDESPQALAAAIRQVSRGDQYLSASLVPLLLRLHLPAEVARTDLSALTDREWQTLGLLAKGLSNKAIAARLYLSVRTVEGHLAQLYEKLGVHSRTAAMRFAIDHDLTLPS
jgi:DNA-binding NarL/FixJ family response regulator